jgi:hypothetical protein
MIALSCFDQRRAENRANQFFKLDNVARLSGTKALSARRAERQWGTLQSEKLICSAENALGSLDSRFLGGPCHVAGPATEIPQIERS